MANTYTQIYMQIVFAVQGRQSLIRPQHNDELQKYITGIISGQGQKLIAINNMPDHFHILVGQKPNLEFLKRFNVPQDPRYIFQPVQHA
jgi:REP element-mobilizing transposase RayT